MKKYQQYAAEIKEREAKQEKLKAEIDKLFTDAGEGNALFNGTEIDGFKVKMVCGEKATLDKKRLVELGCEPAWLEEATEITPNKPYVRITPPSDKKK